nr:uncharacterized protein LOC109156632 [Ipomoea trifida]
MGNRKVTSQQGMEDSVQELKDNMETWKNEMLKQLRLNKPLPPVIDPSTIQGRAQPHPPTLKNEDMLLAGGMGKSLMWMTILRYMTLLMKRKA